VLSSILDYFASKSLLDGLRDVADVATVYYIVYRALLVLRGTRAMQIGIGLLFVFVLYLVAAQLHLPTLLTIMGALIPGAVIIVVIVFQNDIRRGLMRMGSQPWFGFARAQESQAIDEVVEASTDLARHRIGALIAFEQDANLDEFVGINKGHTLDAKVSSELLVSIFIPEGVNKLHDGAVIIRNLRVAKAGVFFPMPEGRVLDPSFGSRHRAALGITEETDAVVVVVSEERGTISFCFNGNIVANLDGPGLRRALEGVFAPRRRRKGAPKREAVPTSVAQRLVTETAPRSVDSQRFADSGEETTLVSLDPESIDSTTRIRTTEPEVETRAPSHAPPPLRRAKAEKPELEPSPAIPAPGRVPLIAPTPMRATLGQRPAAEGATRPQPSKTEDRTPDSSEGETFE